MSFQIARTAAIEGEVFVPKLREQRLTGRRLVVILEQACVELVHVGKGRHELLDGARHKKLLVKHGDSRDLADLRPDITYQCLQALLNSPLNKSGHLLVYIRTSNHTLIEVSPQLSVPRTFHEFESLFATLLVRKSVRAKESKATLLRIIKNDINELLPAGCRRFGLEVVGRQVVDATHTLSDFAKEIVDQQRIERQSNQAVADARAASWGWRNKLEAQQLTKDEKGTEKTDENAVKASGLDARAQETPAPSANRGKRPIVTEPGVVSSDSEGLRDVANCPTKKSKKMSKTRRSSESSEPCAHDSSLGALAMTSTTKSKAQSSTQPVATDVSASGPIINRLALVSDFAAKQSRTLDLEGKPIVFVIGAVAHGSPATSQSLEFIEEDVCISKYPLSAAVCCAKLCDAFERVWC